MQLYRAEKLLWHWLFCPRVGMCLHCFQYDIYTTFTKPKKQLDSSYLWMRLQSPKSSQYDWHLSLIFCLCAGSKVAAASFADCASASNTQSVVETCDLAQTTLMCRSLECFLSLFKVKTVFQPRWRSKHIFETIRKISLHTPEEKYSIEIMMRLSYATCFVTVKYTANVRSFTFCFVFWRTIKTV